MSATNDHQTIEQYELASWNRCAGDYTDGFGSLVKMSVPSLLDAAGVQVDCHVLDIGTGPGIVASAAHKRGSQVTGIDFSESMIAEARRRYPDIEFQQANAESLPFEASRFDVVVSNFVFHHLAAPDKVLGEAHRVLRDGGKMAFTVWEEFSKLVGFGIFLNAMEKHAEAVELPHGPLFGVNDYNLFREMMHKAGFREVSVREIDIQWNISSIDSFLDVFTTWANLKELPESTRAAIEAEVRESAKQLASKGALELANPAILVSGVK